MAFRPLVTHYPLLEKKNSSKELTDLKKENKNGMPLMPQWCLVESNLKT